MNLESLKKYDIYYDDDGAFMEEIKDGEYVKYEDVEKLVKELEERKVIVHEFWVDKETMVKTQTSYQDDIAKLEAENKRLREALKPLSNLVEEYMESGHWPDNYEFRQWSEKAKEALKGQTK